MQEDRETLELALECYTELLDLLDFLFLPGVLRKRAECLLSLVKITLCQVYLLRISHLYRLCYWDIMIMKLYSYIVNAFL